MAAPAVVLAETIFALIEQGVQFIMSLKAQGGLTDDEIAAAALKAAGGNDAAYQAIMARIGAK